MKTKRVLIISHADDGTSKLLIQRLEEIRQPYQLIDLGKFPCESTATIDIASGTSVSLSQNGLTINGSSIKSVWWRRPKGKARSPVSADPVQKYIALESEVFISSLFSLLGTSARWVSDPDKTRAADRKPLQLAIAKQIGFQIPKTLISNDPNKVRSFLDTYPEMPIIMKPVGTSFVRLSEDPDNTDRKNLVIYTRLTDKTLLLRNIQRVQNCPVIFQEAVLKDYDVRITVVGKQVFAVKITHDKDAGAGNSNLDWRHHRLNRKYEKYELSGDIVKKCLALVSRLGLNFGAIDMCHSKDKGDVFLEVNPQGQWVPSEILVGHPVSHTLAAFLARC